MASPEFTVVIALYNKEPFIRHTLQSALSQEYPPKEILVVDDGSTDRSVDQIADLIGGEVRLIRQTNSGPGPARNRGFAEARHEWVALLDADDLWLPDHLATLAEMILAFPAADVVNTASSLIRAGGQSELVAPNDAGTDGHLSNYFSKAGTRESVWSSSVAIRATAFAKSGGFGAFWPGEDVELWARLALDHTFASSPHVTSLYAFETGGLMEQGGGTRFAPGEEPEYLVLQSALSEPRYSTKHAEIRAYRHRLLAQRVRQALYGGDRNKARAFLRLIDGDQKAGLAVYRLLSHLPNGALRLGFGGYRWVKSLGAASGG